MRCFLDFRILSEIVVKLCCFTVSKLGCESSPFPRDNLELVDGCCSVVDWDEEGIEVVSSFIDLAFVSTSNCCEVGQILVLFVDSLGNLFSIAESIATTVKGSSLNHFYNFLSLLRDILSPLIAFHNLFLAFKL